MADKADLLAEAYKRGVLPPDQSAAFEEALRRGVVQNPEALALADARRRSGHTPGLVRSISEGGSFNLADELDAGSAALETGARNLLAKTGLVKPAGYSMGQARDAVMQSEGEAIGQFRQEHPAQDIGGTVVGAIANPASKIGLGWIKGAPTIATGVARAAAVGGAQGAAYGAGGGQGLGGRAQGAVVGGGIGAVTGGALQGGSAALRASAARAGARPVTDALKLSRQDVDLTPGTIAGGGWKRVEDALTSVPIAGDAIRNAQRRSIESFDAAAINKVLAPLGKALPAGAKVGRDGVKLAQQTVSDAYDSALGHVTVVPDQQFAADVAAVAAKPLRGTAADEIKTAIDDINSVLSGPVGGKTLKELDEQLGASVRNAPSGPIGRAQKRALMDLQDSLDGLLGRADPKALAGKQAADEAFANLVRVETAAGGVGAKGGLFTPNQLQSAVKASAGGGRRASKFARGEALMQDLSDPASQVMPSTVPDSGTALRSIFTGNLFGVGVGAALGVPAHILYSKPVVSALNAIYRSSTPGQARAALANLQAMAARQPALQPVYQAAVQQLQGGPANASSGQIPQLNQSQPTQ